MTEERDIAGFALPFAAGIFAAAYMPVWWQQTPVFFLLVVSAGMAALIHPIHKRLSDSALTTIITVSTLCCGVFIGLSHYSLSISSIGDAGSLTAYASEFGTRLKDLIFTLPFQDESAKGILTALITGDRQHLAPDTIDAFRASGASHILALSGLHLGIIYGVLKSILSSFGNRRMTRISRSVLIIAGCGFYTLATGAGPSIVRAFLFILLGETASLTGRFKSTGHILMSALFLQLVYDPGSARNVGFQLSYAAMATIAYIYPFLKKLWPARHEEEGLAQKSLRWIWNSASMSIACQITTGPLAYLYFGTFPQYFIMTNLIALPLVGLIIPMGLLAILVQACGIESNLIAAVTETLITIMTDCLRTISTL